MVMRDSDWKMYCGKMLASVAGKERTASSAAVSA